MAVHTAALNGGYISSILLAFPQVHERSLKSHVPEFMDEFIKEAFSALKENLAGFLSYLSLERKIVHGLGALQTLSRN